MIVDTRGNPYETVNQGASRTLPDLYSWMPGLGSADSDIVPEMDDLRAGSRDLEANNGIAAGLPQIFIDNAIGTELKVQSKPDWEMLGQTPEWAKEWSNAVERDFGLYANDPLAFDFEGLDNFTEHAGLTLRGAMANGGHVILPMWVPDRPGRDYATCFLGVEIDRVSNPKGEPDTDRMVAGVEKDADGRAVALHIKSKHPGNIGTLFAEVEEWTRVPLETEWGRRRAIHCYFRYRSGMSRGKPIFSPVMREFKGLSRYRQAELSTAVAHALNTYFLQTEMSPEQVSAMFTSEKSFLQERKDAITAPGGPRDWLKKAQMDTNQIVPLFPNDKLIMPKNARPNEQFGPFSESSMRHILAAPGVSYETGVRDFSKTTFAGARAIMTGDWKRFLGVRAWLKIHYVAPVFETWLEEAVNIGRIEAPGYYQNRAAYSRCAVQATGRGWLDPAGEGKAAKTRLDTGVTNLEIECADQGHDWRNVMHQHAAELSEAFKIVKRLELPEAAAYYLAGAVPPSNDILTTGIGDGARLGNSDAD